MAMLAQQEDALRSSMVPGVDVAKQLHKTKICKHFLKDKCRFGADCSYAHCSGEQRDRPNLRKTKLCRLFEQGRCRHEDCCFAHGPQELRGTVGVWKTVLCSKFAGGTCRQGRSCRFAHGELELQSPGPQGVERVGGVNGGTYKPQHFPGPLPVPPFGYSEQFEQFQPAPVAAPAQYGAYYPAPSAQAFRQGLHQPPAASKDDSVETVAQLVSLMSEYSGDGEAANEDRRHVWPATPDFVPCQTVPLPRRPQPPLSPLSPEAMSLLPPSLFSPEGEHRPRGL